MQNDNTTPNSTNQSPNQTYYQSGYASQAVNPVASQPVETITQPTTPIYQQQPQATAGVGAGASSVGASVTVPAASAAYERGAGPAARNDGSAGPVAGTANTSASMPIQPQAAGSVKTGGADASPAMSGVAPTQVQGPAGPVAGTANTSASMPTQAQMPAQAPIPTPQAPIANQPQVIPDSPTSTQTTLLISELRDGVVIMKDGSFRAVIACKSINFDLMSEMEREGVEYSYQNFLNSLNFPTQILIRSQRVDIGPYLERLTELRKNNDNMLLGVLMDDYINFIDILSQEANIMDKSFFIVIPYYPNADAEKVLEQTKSFFKSFGQKNKTAVTKIDRGTYEKALTELNNRVESVVSGLFQVGIHSVRLNTKELSELYYNFNNPDTAVREPFIDFNKMATMYVRKGQPNEKGAQNA